MIKGERVQVPVLLDIARDDFIGVGNDDFFLDQKFLLMVIVRLFLCNVDGTYQIDLRFAIMFYTFSVSRICRNRLYDIG